MVKVVQIYPSIDGHHTAMKLLLENPPEGYKFVGNKRGFKQKIIFKISNYYFLRYIYRKYLKRNKPIIFNFLPKPKLLDNVDLILSNLLINDINNDWILYILDHPCAICGYNAELFSKNKYKIEKILEEENCKAIICANNSSIDFFKLNFNKNVIKKLNLIYPSIKLEKTDKKRNFNLLFMGSINNPNDFYVKGGIEAIETFKILSKKHKNLRLIIRCKIPHKIKKDLQYTKNIDVLDKEISFNELINLYKESLILISPAAHYMLMSTLESMACGLPVVALDNFASKDHIINNITGFLINPDKNEFYKSKDYPLNFRSRDFLEKLGKINKRVIRDLVDKINLLIEDKKLWREMSKNSMIEINKKFNLEKNRLRLKNIFDESIDNN
jgi:glycosyltransferase involved in cell wall biosynthesis